MKDSIQKLQNAARLIPRDPMVHYYLGKIWCAEGNLDEGEKEFRLALRNNPSLAAGHFELARLRYLRGDPDRCLDEIQRAFKVNPVYTQSKGFPRLNTKKMRLFSAKCHEFKGQFVEAARDWREIANVSRDPGAIQKKVKKLFSKAKKQAKRRKKKLLFDPEELQALIDKGIAQVDEGDLQSAKTILYESNGDKSGGV